MKENIENNIDDTSEEIDAMNDLIKANFISMLERKDQKAISEMKNNPIEIINLAFAMGATLDVVLGAAQFQMVREVFEEILADLEEAVKDCETSFSVNISADNVLDIDIQSFHTQDDYKMLFGDGTFSFRKSYLRSRLGTGERIVQGSVSKKSILDFEERNNLNGKKEIAKRLTLDDEGFVIREDEAVVTSTYKTIPGTTKSKIETSKEISQISRDGAKVNTSNSNSVAWNGDPLHLNRDEESPEEVLKRIIKIGALCPFAPQYYKDVLGIDLKEILKESEVKDVE